MGYNRAMQTVWIILWSISSFLLVLVASITPRRSILSLFELERRRKQGNSFAAEELRREVMADDVIALRRVVEALLLVISVVTAVGGFGVPVGIAISVVLALFYGRVAKADVVHHVAERLFEHFEPAILRFIDKNDRIMKFIRVVPLSKGSTEVCSREELEHIIDTSRAAITTNERKFIKNGLHFNEKTVESVMTPRNVLETIGKDEVIGPLMLDELHRTGHSRFPVIDGDIDHVIGVLHIKELLTLREKTTQTAGQAMEKKVYYINQDQTLDHALAAFLKTRHHLFIVVNGYRETAGIVTLEDVIEALLGREIVDEFDLHDDLRVVAARNAKHNNNSTHGANV
jgi:tlyC family hemolysin